MEFSQFIDLPAQLKVEIINKCSPFSYVRLRRTCRFVDEFCEKYRKQLAVYCPKDEYYVGLHYEYKKKSYYIIMRGHTKGLRIPLIPDNMIRINKALSGFAIADSRFHKLNDDINFDNALNYLLEAVPDFKVSFLDCDGMTAEQIERVVASKWKIRGMKIICKLEMWKILQIDAVRKMDPLYCEWSKEDDEFSEEDIVQLARGKKRAILYPGFLSTSSRLNVLKRIVQNWKNDGHFPIQFYMDWKIEKQYMEADISGLYSDIMDQEAFYMGNFKYMMEDYVDQRNDIWIRKNNNTWQCVTLKRYGLKNYGNEIIFIFETAESTADFKQIMRNCIYNINYVRPVEEPSLYEACLTENMEKIKEAFVKMIPNGEEK